jgi:hypothetical protein
MALYNTFTYGDGTLYTDPAKLIRQFGVVADPNPGSGGLSFQSTQRVSVRVTQSGGTFVIAAIRPIIEDAGHYPSNYDIPAEIENVQRVSLRFNFNQNSLFNLVQIRPIVEVRGQEPIG